MVRMDEMKLTGIVNKIANEEERSVFDNEPKRISIEDASRIFNAKYLQGNRPYETDESLITQGAIQEFATSVKKMPSQLQMAYGQAQYSLGSPFFEEDKQLMPKGGSIFYGTTPVDFNGQLRESGRINIETANRNLERLDRELDQLMPNISPEDRESFMYQAVQQAPDYALMLALSYVNPTLGMGYMSAKTLGQETEEGATKYKQKFGTIEGFEQYSGDELLMNVANTAMQSAVEKIGGVPGQLKVFKNARDIARTAFIGGAEEFVTENVQNLIDAGFDHISGRLEKDETIASVMMDNFKGTLVAAMFGGASGMTFAINNRANGIKMYEDMLDGSDVPVEKRSFVAENLYNENLQSMQEVITKELELDSQLRAKHGSVMDAMKEAIDKQYRDAGAFKDKTESEIAQMVNSKAKEFADITLSEAHKRNTLIENVVNSKNIEYKDGQMYLTEKRLKSKGPKPYYSGKTNIDFANDLISKNVSPIIENLKKISDEDLMIGYYDEKGLNEIASKINWRDFIGSILSKYEIVNEDLKSWLYDNDKIDTTIPSNENFTRNIDKIINDWTNEYDVDRLPLTSTMEIDEDNIGIYPEETREKLKKYQDDDYVRIVPSNEEELVKNVFNALKSEMEEETGILAEGEIYRIREEETLLLQEEIIDKLNSQANVVEFNYASLKDPKEREYLENAILKNSKPEDVAMYREAFDKMEKTADAIYNEIKDKNISGTFVKMNDVAVKLYKDSDGQWKPMRSIFVNNGDYEFNIDFGTVCVKRQGADTLIKILVDKNLGSQLGVVQLENIKKILVKHGIATACDICFVETKRVNARDLSNGFAYEWDSVRKALGIEDGNMIGHEYKFTKEQQEMLDRMASLRYIDDDGKILSDKELEQKKKSMTKEQYKNFKDTHKQEYQVVYDEIFGKGGRLEERARNTKLNNKGEEEAIDRGITSSKMRMIAKLFIQNSRLAGKFDPDSLMNSADTSDLVNTYFDTDLLVALSSYAGAGTPKALLQASPYSEISWREPIDEKKNKEEIIQKLFDIGGVRGQSFSDYDPMRVIDYLQKYTAQFLRGLPAHEYTKEPSLIKTFGKFGVMFNMSIIPEVIENFAIPLGTKGEKLEAMIEKNKKYAGLKRATQEQIDAYNESAKKGTLKQDLIEGKIANVWTEKGGESWVYAWHSDSFPIEEALKFRRNKAYGGRVGTIAVGVSSNHIRMMLNDPTIDMVIPYHSSGMPAHTKLMTKLNMAMDFQKVQTTKGLDGKDDFKYNRMLREIGDPRKTAEAYKDFCKSNEYTPKFAEFMNENNYYKLLEDFRGYDEDGNPVIQQAVNLNNLTDEDWKELRNTAFEEIVKKEKDNEKFNKLKSVLDEKSLDNENIELTAEEKAEAENFKKEIEEAVKYQRVDDLTKKTIINNIKKAIGMNNVVVAKQNDFLQYLYKAQGENQKSLEEFRRERDGVVYGFAYKDKIYLNENYMNAHTPAHEFTHLWVKVIKEYKVKENGQWVRPYEKLWKQGVSLLKSNQVWYTEGVKRFKGSDVWLEVLNDPDYYNIRDNEDLIASEVLSRIVGRQSELFAKVMLNPNEKMLTEQEGFLKKAYQWLTDFFNAVMETFGWKDEHLTLAEFAKMPFADMMDPKRAKAFKEKFDKWKKAQSSDSEIDFMKKYNSEVMSDVENVQNTNNELYQRDFDDDIESEETIKRFDLNLNTKSYKYYYNSLEERQDQGIGNDVETIFSNNDFDVWLELRLKHEREEYIKNRTFDDFGISLEDFNTDNGTEFETEQEALQYMNKKDLDYISVYVGDDIGMMSHSDREGYQRDYLEYLERDEFFDDYQSMVAGILEENGFEVLKDRSNISQSRYLDVYKDGEHFANIRISDHDTYRFYGYNINLYTTNPIDQELLKLKESFAEGKLGVYESVYQGGKRGKVKGSYDYVTKSIKITNKADFSTYSHEFAHFWLDNMWEYANSGQASEEYLKQFQAVRDWLGVGARQKYFTREQHEKFARGYEKFLLSGITVKPIIASVFDDYDKYLRDVYDDLASIDEQAGKEYEEITPAMYDFFNSMISGELPKPDYLVEKETIKDVQKEEAKVTQDAKEVNETQKVYYEEERKKFSNEPVGTDYGKSYLRAYERMTGEQVSAKTTSHDEQYAKAKGFVYSNPYEAKRVIDGLQKEPDGILRNAIYIAYNELMKKTGNTEERVKSMLNQAMELRRYGQEIESQKILYNAEEMTTPEFWIREVMRNRTDALAKANKMSVLELNNLINEKIKPVVGDLKAVKKIAKELRERLGVTELFQSEFEPQESNVASYNYVYKYVNEQLGLSISNDDAKVITQKSDEMRLSLENSESKNGNPSVDYFVKLKEMEDFANSIAPSSELRVAVSVIGKGNLMFSLKSPTTNIVSNAFVAGYRAIVRRILLGQTKSIVDPDLIKRNKTESWDIFKRTGYNLNNMTEESPRHQVLGEHLTHSQGEGNIRKMGRLWESIVYKWSLGAPDLWFKDLAFNDYVSLKATKEANGDVNKANEIYLDAIKINPETDLGKQIRKDAIEESLISTYQNNSWSAKTSIKARSLVDFGFGFGEFIAPFVKTPANVIEMGLKSSFGGIYAIADEAIRDVKAGKVLPMKEGNVALCVENGIGLLLAYVLSLAFDEEDYMPSYLLASTQDRKLAKELKIPFNAIRIGDKWISLDYFGPLSSTLSAILQLKREESVLDGISGYVKAGGQQAISLPGLGNISDLFSGLKNITHKKPEDVLSDTFNNVAEATIARVIPAISSDIAKAFDNYEREASTLTEKVEKKIPFVRQNLQKKINMTTGRPETIDNAFWSLFAGSRVKTQEVNTLAREFQKLNDKGFGVNLTDVTRSGLLSKVDDEQKAKIKNEFAVIYSQKVREIISSSSYKQADDEKKRDMIDSARRKIVEDLKKKYLKKK